MSVWTNLSIGILTSISFNAFAIKTPPIPIPSAKTSPQEERLAHARELMGSAFKKSVVRKGESISDVEVVDYIRNRLRRGLPARWLSVSNHLARAIVSESKEFAFDPLFVLAVIENESRFRPDARGTSGEIGLMQILPDTARWITARSAQSLPDSVLEDPIENIRIGISFLASLRDEFNSHGRLYLSAYNMGSGNVRRNLSQKIWPKEYVSRVMSFYVGYYSALAASS